MKSSTRIKRAKGTRKNEVYLALSFGDRAEALAQIICGLHKGARLLDTLKAEVNEVAGVFAELDVSKKVIRGLASVSPEKVGCSFTLGLEEIRIK